MVCIGSSQEDTSNFMTNCLPVLSDPRSIDNEEIHVSVTSKEGNNSQKHQTVPLLHWLKTEMQLIRN